METKNRALSDNFIPLSSRMKEYIFIEPKALGNSLSGSRSGMDGRYKLTLVDCTHCMHFSADYEKGNEQIFSSPVPN